MIRISRSAVSTRKLCPMKRYWAYHAPHPDLPVTAQVGGLTPREDASARAKTRGTLIHALLEAAVQGGDVDATLDAHPEWTADMDPTLVVLCRRVVKGWSHMRAPLLADYRTISAECEWEWSLDPLVTQTLRLDQILRHKETNDLLILDYKTLARPDLNWVDRLRHSDQTHLYIQALTERTEEPVAMQYEGLLIGTYEDGVYKSPLVSAYQQRTGALNYTWSAGAQRLSTTDWPDDEWLAWAYELELLAGLYCTTGPLQPPTAQLLATKAATVHAELQWADTLAQLDVVAHDPAVHTALRERLIERNADACLKFGKGYACPYGTLCWQGYAPDLETFVPRIDHHSTESPA